MKKLVIFASGEGSNFQAILDNMHQIDGEIVALVVDRECNAIKRAEKSGIPVFEVSRKSYNSKDEFDSSVLDIMNQTNADYYILAGFMSILGSNIVESFERRIVNIHPSLLPAFPGLNSIEKAFDYGVKYTGCTVHFVDSGVDTGPIIAQKVVPILEGYTLEKLTEEIHKAEHELYPKVIKDLCLDILSVDHRRIVTGEEWSNEN